MNRTMRCNVFISILKSLWQEVEEYRRVQQEHNSFSSLVEEACNNLLMKPRPLIRAPRRRPSQHQLSKYKKKRTYVSIDPNYVLKLRTYYEKEAGNTVDSSVVVETALFYYCVDRGLKIRENEYFGYENYQKLAPLSEKDIIKAYHRLAIKLGKSPTSREWTQYRHEVQAPSLKVVLHHFLTFNNLKSAAEKGES